MTTAAATYTCPKCNGTGNLRHYANIAGGTCFSCHGRGVKTGRKPVPSAKFVVSAVLRETGQRIDVFAITAKSAEAALTKARAQLARGTGYFADTAAVVAD